MKLEVLSLVLRLDCLSCVLTVVSTILVGRRCWEGWVLAAANSLIICVIGLRTAQLGFIPANLFCIVLYAVNLRTWRKAEVSDQRPQVAAAQINAFFPSSTAPTSWRPSNWPEG
jgi:nicotinamide riboside transporter PnuC